MDVLIIRLKESGYSYLLQGVYFGVKFNTTKSVATRIGNRYNKVYEPFVLSGNNLQFVCSLKYHGIVLLLDRRVKFCVDTWTRESKFFSGF